MDIQDSSKNSQGNEEPITGSWRILPNANKSIRNKPYSLWKAELSSNELGYLAEISKISVQCTTWFLLIAYSKMQEEREKLREKLFNKI